MFHFDLDYRFAIKKLQKYNFKMILHLKTKHNTYFFTDTKEINTLLYIKNLTKFYSNIYYFKISSTLKKQLTFEGSIIKKPTSCWYRRFKTLQSNQLLILKYSILNSYININERAKKNYISRILEFSFIFESMSRLIKQIINPKPRRLARLVNIPKKMLKKRIFKIGNYDFMILATNTSKLFLKNFSPT